MRLLKAKGILLFVVLFLLGSLVASYFLFANRPADYYILIEGPLKIQVGNPVLVEKSVAGKVTQSKLVETEGGIHLIRFSLSRDYSIPKNSVFDVINPHDGKEGSIEIRVMASKDYYQPGDTVFNGRMIGAGKEVPLPAQVEQAKTPENLVYKVQLMVSVKAIPANSAHFKGIQAIEEVFSEGVFKYYTGNPKTLSEAKELRSRVVKKGIPDAFIVPFLNDQRISIQQALDYEK